MGLHGLLQGQLYFCRDDNFGFLCESKLSSFSGEKFPILLIKHYDIMVQERVEVQLHVYITYIDGSE
jgi:hypothetical protein